MDVPVKVEANISAGREHCRLMQGKRKHLFLAIDQQCSPFEHFAFC